MTHVGRFQLVRELGSGGFGTVHEGVDQVSGARVAVKVLDRTGGTADAVRSQLSAEASALRSVDSPNSLRVIEVVDADGVLALVTDFVDAAPLRLVLDEHGRLSGQDALTVLWGAGQGLSAVHAAGLVHGDVKPANILIEPSGNSKLIDFGLASLPGWIAEDSSSPWGSPAYAPPEQVAHEYRDHRSDIYSLTVTLYEVLCGQRPFAGETVEGVRYQHVYEPLPDPRLFAPGLGDGLTQLLMWGHAKNPDERPQDVATWLAYLQAAAEDKYGPAWFTAASIGAIAGGLISSGIVASGVLTASLASAGGAAVSGATAAGVAGVGGSGVVGSSGTVGVASGTGTVASSTGVAASSGAAGTTASGAGFLATVSGKVAVGLAVVGLAAGSGIAAKAIGDDASTRHDKPSGPTATPLEPMAPAPRIQKVERLAFARCDTEGDGCGIFTMNPEGSHELSVAPGGNDPAWSPDGKKIAYWSSSGLYVVGADGSGRKQLADFGVEYVWSPDGTKIAYWDTGGLYVVHADGSARKKLADGFSSSASSDETEWSPDGTSLAFSEGNVKTRMMRVIRANGSGEIWHVAHGSRPRWSPDGSKLAFEDDTSETSQVVVVSADGSNRTELGEGSGHRWSPDGTQLSFWASGFIDVVRVDGSDSMELVHPRGGSLHSWSPDGAYVAFDGFSSEGPIDIINVDGANQRTPAGCQSGEPGPTYWSPRSNQFAYVCGLDGDPMTYELWVADATALSGRRVATGSQLSAPAWGLVPQPEPDQGDR